MKVAQYLVRIFQNIKIKIREEMCRQQFIIRIFKKISVSNKIQSDLIISL